MGRVRISWDGIGLAVGVLLVLLVGGLEAAHPLGLSLSRLTGGLLTLDLLIRAGIFTVVLVGLNLLMGYAGQVSLGQAAFYGMGAFCSAILTVRARALGIPSALSEAWWWPWAVMAMGAVGVGLLAYRIGRPVLRLRGHYLAMATLGLGIAVYILLRENLGLSHLDLTGGFDGIQGIPRLRLGGLVLWPAWRYFLLVWSFAFGAILLGRNVVRSRVGRALRAIHGSEMAAESVGVEALGFVEVAREEDRIYLGGLEERDRYSLILRKAEAPGVTHIAFRVADPGDLDRLADLYQAAGCPIRWLAPEEEEAGQGRALRVQDPSGLPVEFFHQIAQRERLLQRFDRYRGVHIMRLDHFNCQVPNVQEAYDWWTGRLGFYCIPGSRRPRRWSTSSPGR